MIIAISNPVGSALGQVISPLVGTVSKSVSEPKVVADLLLNSFVFRS